MVGLEVVGTERTNAIWGSSPDLGYENVPDLVPFRILQLVPVTNPEHVVGSILVANEVNDPGLLVLSTELERLAFSPLLTPVVVTILLKDGVKGGVLRAHDATRRYEGAQGIGPEGYPRLVRG